MKLLTAAIQKKLLATYKAIREYLVGRDLSLDATIWANELGIKT